MSEVETDPHNVVVSEFNERQTVESTDELEQSVKTSWIQNPIVRETPNGADADFEVIIGQRRVQAAQNAGLESIRVSVVDWEDADALGNSIKENIEAFRESVSPQDRAVAVERFKNLKGYDTNKEVAEYLGVTERAVRKWREPLHRDWKGTQIQPDVKDTQHDDREVEVSIADKVGSSKLEEIRRITGGGDAGIDLAEVVAEEGVSLHELEEVRQKVEREKEIEEAVEEVVQERKAKEKAKKQKLANVSARVSFTSNYATAIRRAGEDRGASDEEIIKYATEEWLDSEGYL